MKGIAFSRAGRAVALVVLAAAALLLWMATSSPAIIVYDKPAPLGLVGLTEGQTLRISVANVVGFDPQPDPPGCVLKVGFAEGDGATIGDPHIAELRPGASQSFDHVAIGNPNIRQYVRPVVSDLTPRSSCPAVVSGELLDRDGITGIVIDWSQPVAPSAFLAK